MVLTLASASTTITSMGKTIAQILTEVRVAKTCSVIQLRRYITQLNIKALGARQRPQRYPADTTARVLEHLGFMAVEPAEPVKLPTMRQLRAERDRSVKARGGR